VWQLSHSTLCEKELNPNLNNKSGRDIDDTLKMYRQAHRAVATYSIEHSNGRTHVKTIIETGLRWEAVNKKCDELTAIKGSGWGKDFYMPLLENQQECIEAQRIISDKFWADLH